MQIICQYFDAFFTSLSILLFLTSVLTAKNANFAHSFATQRVIIFINIVIKNATERTGNIAPPKARGINQNGN
jgi:hypothetical protein